MLARAGVLRHPNGTTIATPLLIPSFSSKGFEARIGGISEIRFAYDQTEDIITDSYLVSAYDINYGFLPSPTTNRTNVVLVDSGGYEASNLEDLSAVPKSIRACQPWTSDLLHGVYDEIPEHINAFLVSFDTPSSRSTLEEQIENANRLFERYKRQGSIFLIKPEPGCDLIPQQKLASLADRLGRFSAIGVTEKELGYSCIDRMLSISKLRIALDGNSISAPIHVFGGLDPITCVLYFLAGAEMFDGLTWLRYSYLNEVATYVHNKIATQYGITVSDLVGKIRNMSDNLGELDRITNKMRRFTVSGDFSCFGSHSKFYSDAFEILKSRNKGV